MGNVVAIGKEIVGTFLTQDALRLNGARLAHLDSLGLWLRERSVYEPGCGIGLLTGFFEQRACPVLSTDMDEYNCAANLALHPWRRSRPRHGDCVLQASADEPTPHGEAFDIVFAYGLLYHVPDPGATLRHLSTACNGLLLLSTLVHHEDDGKLHPRTQWAGADQGARGQVYLPARDWVMTELAKHFPYVYVSRQQPDSDQYPTKWPARRDYWKRAVFVASRNELVLPGLSTTLLMEQEAYSE